MKPIRRLSVENNFLVLSRKKECMSPYNFQHIPKHFNLYIKPSQQTLSNAFSTSTETPLTSNDGYVSKPLLILCITESNGCMQGSPG